MEWLEPVPEELIPEELSSAEIKPEDEGEVIKTPCGLVQHGLCSTLKHIYKKGLNRQEKGEWMN